MNNKKIALISSFLALPMFAFADHEEVLFTMLIAVIEFVAFFIFIGVVKIKASSKVILSSTFLIATCIIYSYVGSKPYTENEVIINWLIGLGAPLSSVLVLLIFNIADWLLFKKR